MVGGCVSFLLVLLVSTSKCAGHLTTNYIIRTTWDGSGLNETDWINFSIGESEDRGGVEININAPFYDDPAPPGGKPGIEIL